MYLQLARLGPLFQYELEAGHDPVADERLDALGVVENRDRRVQHVLQKAAVFFQALVLGELEEGPGVSEAATW